MNTIKFNNLGEIKVQLPSIKNYENINNNNFFNKGNFFQTKKISQKIIKMNLMIISNIEIIFN